MLDKIEVDKNDPQADEIRKQNAQKVEEKSSKSEKGFCTKCIIY